MTEDISYPIRINHFLALHNVASRRQADVLIADGKVTINGKVAVLGDKVNEGDHVELVDEAKQKLDDRRYYIFHKPQGMALENSKINPEAKKERPLFALDRLDKETSGLILASDDFQAKDMLENPRFNFPEEYLLRLHRPVGNELLEKLKHDASVKILEVEQVSPYNIRMKLTGGNIRLIRELLSKHKYEITSLRRVSIAGISLNNLKEGVVKQLKGTDLENFLSQIQ